MFHELGHFLLHVPETGATANFHRVGERTRKEKEADLFALCALIPKCLVERLLPDELIDETSLTPDQVAERLEIFSKYGF
jgi:Zn-dependent peptidase ImmA (M78 family)